MNRLLCILLFFFGVNCLSAQTAIQKAVDAFAKDAQLIDAGVSISVLDQKTGSEVAAYHPQSRLIPASILKVITTAMALEVLVKDFQFQTHLEHDGSIDAQGVLHGNLYIKGYGDPTLGSHHFKAAEKMEVVLKKWVQAVEAHGIKKVEGKIIGDASHFSGAPCAASWPWEDLGNYYGAGAWGLNLQENLYFLHLQQKRKLGETPGILKIEPPIPNLLLLNELKSAEMGSGDQAYIFGGPYSYTRFVRGTIPVGSGTFKVKGSIPDPPFFAAHQLMKELDRAGIACTSGATSQFEEERTNTSHKKSATLTLNPERRSFYEYHSPRLLDIIKEANLKSINIYCEALLKAIGEKEEGEGSIAVGLAVIKKRMEAKGIALEGFFMKDGSGLSPRNALSSSQLSTFLYQLSKDKENFPLFYQSLAVGGKSGTLKYLFKGTVAEGKIRGKSGGMGSVRSYTGYVKTLKGKDLVFTMIANNYTGKAGDIRRKMERLMIDLCKTY